MKKEDQYKLIEKIEYLASETTKIYPVEAENICLEILRPLLAEDGYEVSQTAMKNDGIRLLLLYCF